MSNIKEQIEALRKEIQRHSDLYYNQDAPEISDYEFDTLMNELKALEKEYPELITPDSPTQKVGGSQGKSTFEKITHTVPMLSLQDVFDFDEVHSFLDKFPDDAVYAVEEKIDGLSVSVTYQNGVLTRAETRGDGYIGEDITENIKCVSGIPVHLKQINNETFPQLLEVRCEVYMPVAEFVRLNEIREKTGEKLFVNPRNAAAGLLRTKEIAAVKNAGLSAFAFNVQQYTSSDNYTLTKHIDNMNMLRDYGFNTVWHMIVTKDGVQEAIEFIDMKRPNLEYWTDGAVIKINDLNLRESVGDTNKYPRWAVAFKYPPEEKETVVKDIILQTGRTGRVTPVAILEPVFLAGTKVEKATLHNPQIIEKLGINIGDTVLVRKAAEIIPEIIKVVKAAYDGEDSNVLKSVYSIFSHNCPSCGNIILPDEDDNGAYCNNSDCPAQIARKFEFWASRDCMDIVGFGPAIIDRFIELGWLKTIPDIYQLKNHYDEMLTLDGFGKKAADNLISAIEKSKDRDMDRLIKSLGISGVGRHIGKSLAKLYPDMYAIENLTAEELSSVNGIGEISAHVIYEYFHNDENLSMTRKLYELGMNPTSHTHSKKSVEGKLTDKTFVITGTLPSMKRDEAAALIEANGGKVSGSVSKKTDYLLAGESAGSKLTKAEALGISVISEDDFKKMIES